MTNVKERTKDVLIDETNVNFESFYLSTPVLQALKEYNFIKPSPIQLKAIPLGKCGLDLIVKSKSGTGKTAVFAVIALEMIDTTKDNLQVLILAPTREIAVQSSDVINQLGKHIKGLKVEHFIGGLPVKEDTVKSKGCHIAVGSPGRILQLITASTLDVKHVKLFVLDEADSLMESSFQADINKIFHSLPINKQMMAVSATFPNELDIFLSQYMLIPTHVSPQIDTPLLLGLKHFVTITTFNPNALFLTKYKNTELIRLLAHVSFTQCLVFCNYQTRAEEVSNFLNTNGWTADYISGAQTQKQRLEVLKKLKEFQCRILLSTDLTARGIDAVNVDLVINYDVPNDESTYLHRMGRAGRYGSKGLCVTMAAKGLEVQKFSDIIGAIGGCEMSVPIIPKDTLPDNLWEADVQGYDLLHGTLKSSGNIKDAKDDILRSVNEILRDKDVDTNVEVKHKKTKTLVNNKVSDLEGRNDLVVNDKDCKDDNNDGEEDTLALLALLAAGKSGETTQKATPPKSSILNKNLSLLSVSSILDDDDLDLDNGKTAETFESFLATLKEPEDKVLLEKTNILDADISKLDDSVVKDTTQKVTPLKHSINNKSLSLLTVSSLLDDDDLDLDSGKTAETFERYIASLKEPEEKVLTEKSNMLDDEIEKSDDDSDGDEAVDLENVFTHAFNYAIDKTKPNWADIYNFKTEDDVTTDKPVNLLQDLLEYVANDENPDDYYEDEDYYDDEEYYVDENYETNQPSMEWIPVETNKTDVVSKQVLTKVDLSETMSNQVCNNIPQQVTFVNGVNGSNEQFEGLFDNAVRHLDECFNQSESEFDFNQVWSSWQRQMNSVRDYVQQNIYVNEMAVYKNNHNNHLQQ